MNAADGGTCFNILALDGGGSKGMVTVTLLRELEKKAGPFLHNIDLFAGTSIGGANAAALASGKSVQSIIEFYNREGCAIFGTRYTSAGLPGRIVSVLGKLPVVGKWVYDFADLFQPKWSNAGLKTALENYFGQDAMLGDVERKLLLTAMELNGRSPYVNGINVVKPTLMTSYSTDTASDVQLYNAVFRSMSAPVYFESHEGYVDGGMFSNNPCLAAYASAVKLARNAGETVTINVLSIGTGMPDSGVPNDGNLTWGLLRWAKAAMGLSATAVDEFDSELTEAILGDRFNRLNIELPHPFDLDDCKNLDTLHELAEKASASSQFSDTVAFIQSRLI